MININLCHYNVSLLQKQILNKNSQFIIPFWTNVMLYNNILLSTSIAN